MTIACAAALAIPLPAVGEPPRRIGVGASVADPLGPTARYWIEERVAIQAVAGWRVLGNEELDFPGPLVAVDWVTSGRRESGERCRFAHYCSRVIVRVDGRLVIHDALALRQEDGELTARLGRFDVLAVAVVIGGIVSSAGLALVKECDGRRVERRPEQLVVASAVEDGRSGDIGCVLRIAGPSVEAVGRTLRTCLSFVPPALGDDPWARKW